MEILRCDIAKHHALEVVSKSQPLKLNSERALTPAVCWQIRLADTVYDATVSMQSMGEALGPACVYAGNNKLFVRLRAHSFSQ